MDGVERCLTTGCVARGVLGYVEARLEQRDQIRHVDLGEHHDEVGVGRRTRFTEDGARDRAADSVVEAELVEDLHHLEKRADGTDTHFGGGGHPNAAVMLSGDSRLAATRNRSSS